MVAKNPTTSHPESLIPTGWKSAASRDFEAHRPVPAPQGHQLLDDAGDWDVEYVLDEPDLPGFQGLPPDSGSNLAPASHHQTDGQETDKQEKDG